MKLFSCNFSEKIPSPKRNKRVKSLHITKRHRYECNSDYPRRKLSGQYMSPSITNKMNFYPSEVIQNAYRKQGINDNHPRRTMGQSYNPTGIPISNFSTNNHMMCSPNQPIYKNLPIQNNHWMGVISTGDSRDPLYNNFASNLMKPTANDVLMYGDGMAGDLMAAKLLRRHRRKVYTYINYFIEHDHRGETMCFFLYNVTNLNFKLLGRIANLAEYF